MLTIRAYQPSDIVSVKALLAELQDYEHALDPYTREAGQPLMDTYFGQIQQWIAEKNGAIYVAEVEAKVVGFVSMIIETSDNLLTTFTRYAYISDIVVDGAYRGRGIAQKLLLAAEQSARDAGCEHLMIETLAENALALKAYRRFGFRDRYLLMHKALT